MRAGSGGVERERVPRGRNRFRERVGRQRRDVGQLGECRRNADVGARVLRVGGRGLLEVVDRLPQRRLGRLVQQLFATQHELVGCRGRRVGASERVGAGVQLETQLARDCARDVVLHREDVGGRPVERFGPRAHAVARANQHGVHPEAGGRLPHRSLEEVGDIELAADIARVDRFPLQRERGRPRRYAQSGNLGERADQIVGDAVGEVLLRGVAAEIRERKHCD